jgi:hypothetical protein
MLTQARQRAALVAPHQARVADNVSGQDRCQLALLTGHGNWAETRPLPVAQRPTLLRVREGPKTGHSRPVYSITSSARASNIGGISRPSAFAALRLMTISNLAANSTGRSIWRLGGF